MQMTGNTSSSPCHHRPEAAGRRDRREAAAVSRLAGSGYPPLRRVCCEMASGVLTISGTVPSYYLKQVAQTLAGTVDGVTRIENRLDVRSRR